MEAASVSTDRRTDKERVVHIRNGVLLGHQKEGNNAICSNMGGPRDCHTSEVRQKEKGKYRMRSVTSVITT